MADRPCPACKGKGRIPALPSAVAAENYMRSQGWEPGAPGESGTLWAKGARAIGVARHMEPGYLEWSSVITRLAWAEGRTEEDVIASISAHEEAFGNA